jgi:type I restriction enzyme R subunit
MSAIAFKPFNDESRITKTHSNLPHWSQTGATHFVTFRLADALPRSVVNKWYERRRVWLAKRNIHPTDSNWFQTLSADDRHEYRRSFGKAFENLMDEGFGEALLQKPDVARLLVDTLKFFNGERYLLGDFVIMPNHVHLLAVPREEFPLNKTLHSWKSFSAKRINSHLDRTGPLWQHESFDHIVRHRGQLQRLRDYIADNPRKANLAAGSYIHQKAEWC